MSMRVRLTNPDTDKSSNLRGSNGASHVYGMARNAPTAPVAAGTAYIPPAGMEIYGFQVLTVGTGAWTMTFKDAAAATTGLHQDGFPAGGIYPFHLTAITTPAGATILVFLGPAEA